MTARSVLISALMAVWLPAGASNGTPEVLVFVGDDSVTSTVVFGIDDPSDSGLIPRNTSCSVSAIVTGSNVLELYQVPDSTTEASAGTIVGAAFSVTTTTPVTVRPSQAGFKARATDSTDAGSKLIIECSSASGGGGELDDFTTPVVCASNIAPIAATTANYQITTGCATDDTIVVADVGTLDAAAIKTMSVINDSGFQLLLDVSANTGGATIESGSSIVPAGSTIAIVQTGDSTVHVIGTGGDLIVSHTAGTTDAIAFDGCLSKLHAVSTTGGSNLTLFDIVSPVGYKCYFLDIDASGFTVTPHSSDIIVLDGVVGVAGKGITNTAAPAISDYFVLIAATSTKWFVESRTGTWVAVP